MNLELGQRVIDTELDKIGTVVGFHDVMGIGVEFDGDNSGVYWLGELQVATIEED